jgi:hypothetical protein
LNKTVDERRLQTGTSRSIDAATGDETLLQGLQKNGFPVVSIGFNTGQGSGDTLLHRSDTGLALDRIFFQQHVTA